MPGENKEEKGLLQKLKSTYRLVVMNNETFEEVGSYRLSLLNVYAMLSAAILVIALLIIAIIFFTPLRRYVPGYGDIREHTELLALYQQIEDMQSQLDNQSTYISSFKRILVGDLEMAPDMPPEEANIPDSLLNVERIAEDEELRKEIALKERIALQSLRAENLSNEASIGQMHFIPPLNGQISETFQPDKKHYGVDIASPKNTPVKAIMDGYVITADWTLDTGHTIGIQHANNLLSFYKHNSALLKKTGTFVQAGEAVAIIGNSGTQSSGPHLHFELWQKGKPINPTDYINFE